MDDPVPYPSNAAIAAAVAAVYGPLTENVPMGVREYEFLKTQYAAALKAAYAVDFSPTNPAKALPGGQPTAPQSPSHPSHGSEGGRESP